MTKQFLSGILALVFLFPLSLLAQKGTIAGKIIDAKLADALIGVTVRLDEGAGGAITDFDGNFTIANVPVGKHKISVNYTGYAPKTIDEIDVKNGEATTIDIAMEDAAATSIAEVVIVARASRESQSALTILQKTSPTIGDGISSESIKRTPDRTTGDVIRRVSGASIQDGKFAVIRGLNDRYNIAMLNGALLTSTEPDRKAFSFDLFPSAMLDNLVIVKTASADLPGEFAGGAILLTTKDIPEDNFVAVNVSGGYNNVTTFKPTLQGQSSSSTDWLGLDNGARALPNGYPTTSEFIAASKEERARFSKLFENDWAIDEKGSAAPNVGVQLTGGYLTAPNKKVQFGATVGLSYSNTNRLQDGQRYDYDLQTQQFEYNDKQFRNNILWGTLLNASLKINNKHKIGIQSTVSTNTDNIINSRVGKDFEQTRDIRSTSIEYTENHLTTSRLTGEHNLSANGARLNWGGGLNRTTRDVPSLRRMFYSRSFDAEPTDPFLAFVPIQADPFRSGRFYSELAEDVVNGNLDLTLPFKIIGSKQIVKVGGLYQGKEREFSARILGWTKPAGGSTNSLLTLPQSQIFADSNIRANRFVMGEITNASDRYDANSDLAAGFILLDNKIGGRLRVSWGMRAENFIQRLNTVDYTQDTININRKTLDWLPSANLTFSINEKNQLRFSASKTVTRPEFRELAPFAFYDFYLNAGVQGNPNLVSGEIMNFDLRYEWYPGRNQLFSASLFYKDFKNPIEFTYSSLGAGTRTFTFQNIPSATNYGVEVELRKNFGFIHESLEGLVFSSNVAIIRSSLNLSNVSSYDTTRALQGQSPYIANVGLSYTIPNFGLNTTLVYNIIGDRVSQVGTEGYGDVYERHRNLLDFQISKKLGTRGEVKLTWGDILRPAFLYYQDNNSNHKYDEEEDNVMQRLQYGSTITLGLGYRF